MLAKCCMRWVLWRSPPRSNEDIKERARLSLGGVARRRVPTEVGVVNRGQYPRGRSVQ